MKQRLSMIFVGVALFFGANVAVALTIAPTPFLVKGHDAQLMSDVLERSGIQEQSAIESSFLQTDEAFCESGSSSRFCQFSVGGGLFVRASVEDSEAFIKVLRKNRALSRPVANGRRWELRNLECSTRFDLATRKLVTQCTFEQ